MLDAVLVLVLMLVWRVVVGCVVVGAVAVGCWMLVRGGTGSGGVVADQLGVDVGLCCDVGLWMLDVSGRGSFVGWCGLLAVCC